MLNRYLLPLLFLGLIACTDDSDEVNIISHEVNHAESNLEFFLMDTVSRSNFYSFGKVKTHLKKDGKDLIFAMNGGMFNPEYQAVGLYIENGKTFSPLNIDHDQEGNFFLLPNGIYGISNDNEPFVKKTSSFDDNSNVKFATQSGPMLVINGKIHPKFKKDSENLNIRNGVGILPNGNSLFAISDTEINFYDFALFFKEQGCENALFLDGFVSKMYLPEEGEDDLGGEFGVIIAEYE
jgi:uncharacterized protein YigE (DUF2233 family)